MPLGIYNKAKVRELAKAFGLSTATRRDSVGICFIGKRRLPGKPRRAAAHCRITTSNASSTGPKTYRIPLQLHGPHAREVLGFGWECSR